jgi:hypothetical protein
VQKSSRVEYKRLQKKAVLFPSCCMKGKGAKFVWKWTQNVQDLVGNAICLRPQRFGRDKHRLRLSPESGA